MNIKLISFFSIILTTNNWANSEPPPSCTNSTGYEYRACISILHKNTEKELVSFSTQLESLLNSESKSLFKASITSWNNYKNSSCALENYSNIGTTGWQSNINECKIIKLKTRIIEVKKLLRFRKEDLLLKNINS
jgi:uncharacterized protein YecT (DUF1311 family)